MALKTFTFSNGGTLTAEYSGTGNNTVTFTANSNTGDLREMDLVFHTASNKHSITRHVILEESPYVFDASITTTNGAEVGLNITMRNNSASIISGLTFTFNGEKMTTTSSNVVGYSNGHFNIRASKSIGNEYILTTTFTSYNNTITYLNLDSDFPLLNLSTLCNNCTSLTLAYVYANITNLYYCFSNCRVLEDVSIHISGREDTITDMPYCFNSCSNLTKVSLPDLYGNNLTTIYRMFNNCANLTNVQMASFRGNMLTNMANAFSNCRNLTNVTFGTFYGNNVTNMAYMFNGCSNLPSINLRLFYGNNVTTAAYAFSNCRSLTEVNLYRFYGTNLTNMTYMFNGCSNLPSINLGLFYGNNVTTAAYAFSNCRNLTEVNLYRFYGNNLTNMSYMFNGCSNLPSINLRYLYGNNVTDMSCTFWGCSNLTNIDLRMFQGSDDGVNMHMTFADCTSLTEIELPEFSAPITNFVGLFDSCFNLLIVYFDYVQLSSVNTIARMYSSCYAIDDSACDICLRIDLTNVTNMYSAFAWSGIKSFPSFSGSSAVLNTISHMCYNCSNLKNVTAVSKLGTGNNVNCYNAFTSCTNLTGSMTIPFTEISNASEMFNRRANSTIIPVYCNSENAYWTIASALDGVYNESWLILLCYNGYTYRISGDLSYPDFTNTSDTNAGVNPELSYTISYPTEDSMVYGLMSNKGAIISYTLLNTSSYAWASNISMDENGVVSFELGTTVRWAEDRYTIANVLATLKWGNTTVNVTSPVYFNTGGGVSFG